MDVVAIRRLLEDAERRAEHSGVFLAATLEEDCIHVPDLARMRRDDPASKGMGAAALRDIFSIADAHALPVDLEHMADEPGLGAYYASLGFEALPQSDGPTVNMRRLPKEPSRDPLQTIP